MEARRDFYPPLVAFLLSLALHALVMGTGHDFFFPEPEPLPDTVVVELIRAEITAPPEIALLASQPQVPLPSNNPEGRDAPAPHPPEPPKPDESKGEKETIPDTVDLKPPAPGDPTSRDEEGDITPVDTSVVLTRTANSRVPDPTATESYDVTLSINEQDERYRGFLYQVRAAIDHEWRWREAILAAGRPGNVVVRMTLNPTGNGARVQIIESSGSPILDQEATVSVQRAPFPAFPRHWSIQRLHLVAQFEYRFGDDGR